MLIPIIKESERLFEEAIMNHDCLGCRETGGRCWCGSEQTAMSELIPRHISSQLALLEELMKIYKEQTSNQVIQSLEESITYLKSKI